MKLAFLWNTFSGYHNACLKELVSREGTELFVCHEAFTEAAPYDESQFSWIKRRIAWRKSSELINLEDQVQKFRPDILIFASWNKPVYRAVAKNARGKAFRIMGMDNCWRGTLKQRFGTLAAPFYVRPLADAVWLPGERQAVFAEKLGFEPRVIMRGSLSCDQRPIAEAYLQRLNEGNPLPRNFLYVGRFAREKGLDTLVKAYEAYRKMSRAPWSLVCCGAGPMRHVLEGRDGIEVKGFVQPERIPETLVAAGCLVLPSDFEPWALVVHEATSAGLPVIASERVGAAVHLVQPNYNGFVFGARDVEALAGLMNRISDTDSERLEKMSRASYLQSLQFSPGLWVDTLLEAYERFGRKTIRSSMANTG